MVFSPATSRAGFDQGRQIVSPPDANQDAHNLSDRPQPNLLQKGVRIPQELRSGLLARRSSRDKGIDLLLGEDLPNRRFKSYTFQDALERGV